MTVAGLVNLGVGTTPATPAAGSTSFYFKTDKRPYYKDDTGTETAFAVSGGIVGPPNAVYLTPTGVDGSASRGDASKPFGTFKSALQACLDGDTLVIGPGVYTLNGASDLPVWPSGLHHLVVQGAGFDFLGTGGTVIQNVGNDGSHIFVPPSHVKYLGIRNLRATVTAGTGRALYCDGTGGGGNYMGGDFSGSLVLQDCGFFGPTFSGRLKDVGIAIFNNVYFEIGGATKFEIFTCGLVKVSDCTFGKTDITYDSTDVDKPPFSPSLDATACGWGSDFKLIGAPGDIGLKGCSLRNVLGSSLTGILRYRQYGGNADTFDFETSPFADVSGNAFDVYNATINSVIKLKVAGAASNTLNASLRSCDVANLLTSNIHAANGVVFDLRGSNINIEGTQIITSGTGAVHVDKILRTYTTDGSTPDVITPDAAGVITFASTPDYCMATPRNGIGVGTVSASGTGPTSVTISYSGSIGDISLVCYWK